MANRKRATAELTADDRGFQRGLGRAEKRLSSFRKMTKKSFGALGSVAAGAMGGIVGGGAMGATAFFAQQAADAMAFDSALVRLGVDSSHAMGSVAEMKDMMLGVSTASGVAKGDVLTLAKTFVDLTGKGDVAKAILGDMAEAARATGASMEDVGTVAATVVDNLKIDPKNVKQAMSIIAAAGKAGSVGFRDMADRLSPLAAQISEFSGGQGARGLADVSSALQLVNRDLKNPEKSATSLAQLMTKLVGNSGKLAKAGVKVFDVGKDGTKTPRAMVDIIEAIGHSKLARDPKLLQDALGSDEAARAARALMRVDGEWRAMAGSVATARDITSDFAEIAASPGGRASDAWNKAKNDMQAAFTPDVIENFSAALVGVVNLAEKIIGTLRQLPEVGEDIADWAYERTHGSDDDVYKDPMTTIRTPKGDYVPLNETERAQRVAHLMGFGPDVKYEETEDYRRSTAAGERHREALRRTWEGVGPSYGVDDGAGRADGGSALGDLVLALKENTAATKQNTPTGSGGMVGAAIDRLREMLDNAPGHNLR